MKQLGAISLLEFRHLVPSHADQQKIKGGSLIVVDIIGP